MNDNILRKSLRYLGKSSRKRQILKEWVRSGKPVPPPHFYKQSTIIQLKRKYKINTLVETGTYLGEMVDACRSKFKQIFSIELDKNLAQNAQTRFQQYRHIKILQGDSAIKLPKILDQINGPALFWLDGHYSEGFTAKGDLNTPIMSELKHILAHKIKDHVILIDDARCFTGSDDYPTIMELETFTRINMPLMNFIVADDIIRITPSA